MKHDLAKCLDDAADLLEKAGWGKGLMKRMKAEDYTLNPYTRNPLDFTYCVVGAVTEMCPTMPTRKIAQALGFKTESAVFYWNDHKVQKQSTIVRRLRKSANRIRKEEGK